MVLGLIASASCHEAGLTQYMQASLDRIGCLNTCRQTILCMFLYLCKDILLNQFSLILLHILLVAWLLINVVVGWFKDPRNGDQSV